MRRATRYLLGAGALIALPLAACGDQPDGEVRSAPTADATQDPNDVEPDTGPGTDAPDTDAPPDDTDDPLDPNDIPLPYGSQDPADWDDAPSATLTLPDGTTRNLITPEVFEAPDVEVVLSPVRDGFLGVEVINHGDRDIAIPDFGPRIDGSQIVVIRDVDMPYERGEIEYGQEPMVDVIQVEAGDSFTLEEHRIGAETDVAFCVEVIDLSGNEPADRSDPIHTGETSWSTLRHSSAPLEVTCTLGPAHPEGTALVDLSTDPQGDTVEVPLPDGRSLMIDGATYIRPDGLDIGRAELADGRTVMTVTSAEPGTAHIGLESAVVDGVVLFTAKFPADADDPTAPNESLAIQVPADVTVAVAELPAGATVGCVQVMDWALDDAGAGQSIEFPLDGVRHAMRVGCSDSGAPVEPIGDDAVLSDLLSE